MIFFIRAYVRVMFNEFDMLADQVAEAKASPLGILFACSSFSWLVGVWSGRSWRRRFMLASDIPSKTQSHQSRDHTASLLSTHPLITVTQVLVQ